MILHAVCAFLLEFNHAYIERGELLGATDSSVWHQQFVEREQCGQGIEYWALNMYIVCDRDCHSFEKILNMECLNSITGALHISNKQNIFACEVVVWRSLNTLFRYLS